MLPGPPIEGVPEEEPEEPDRAGGDERGAPAPGEDDPGDEDGSDDGPHVRPRVEDAGGEGALLLGEPFGDRLDRGGVVCAPTQAAGRGGHPPPRDTAAPGAG